MMHTVLVLVTAMLSVVLSVPQPGKPGQDYRNMVERCKKRMPLMPRYKGLMMRADTKALLRDERVLREVYELGEVDDYATFDFPATCSTKEWTHPTKGGEKGVELETCTHRWLTEIFPPGCCKTRNGFIAPLTVCPAQSNGPPVCLNVIQKTGAFQMFQVGTCQNGGEACGGSLEGGCTEDQRLENVLVEMDGETVFVPVLVPNKCICVVDVDE